MEKKHPILSWNIHSLRPKNTCLQDTFTAVHTFFFGLLSDSKYVPLGKIANRGACGRLGGSEAGGCTATSTGSGQVFEWLKGLKVTMMMTGDP